MEEARGSIPLSSTREPQRKRCAAAGGVRDVDRRIVIAGELFNDREPESRSWHRAGGRRSVEAGEDMRLLLVGDSRTMVDHRHRATGNDDFDCGVGRRKLHRIVEQVAESTFELGESQWVLLDYGDVVVHVFAEETRRYYEIERLYRDRPSVDWRV